MYTTKKIKVSPTSELDILATESGLVCSKVVALIRKVNRKKGFWLSQGAVQKYMRLRGYNLHSQTIQAIIESYFDSLKSYFRAVKSNPEAKPPKRAPHFFKVRWKSSAISLRDGVLRLSNGKGNPSITLQSTVEQSMWKCISNEAATIPHWSTKSIPRPNTKQTKRLR